MPLRNSDILAAGAAIMALVGYVGLVAVGKVEFRAGVIEALAGILAAALGYDTLTDAIED